MSFQTVDKVHGTRDTRDMESLWFLCQKLKFLFYKKEMVLSC